MNPRALIGLGSNLGDRRAILDAAVQRLRDVPGINLLAVSRYHETRPIGGPSGQGDFLNAVVVLESALDARSLLRILQDVESQLGRVRIVRWGERTIDLDLLLYGDQIVETPELILPHPRLPFRRFMLAPAAEVAPGFIDPLTKRSIADLLANLDRRPSLIFLDFSPRTRLNHDLEHVSLVQELLAHRLNGTVLRRENLSLLEPRPSHPMELHYARLKAMAERLSPRHLAEYSPDSWLIADVSLANELVRGSARWFDKIESSDQGLVELSELGSIVEAAMLAVDRALRPTFEVWLGESGRPVCESRTPLLIPEATGPAGIAEEIAANCEATRS